MIHFLNDYRGFVSYYGDKLRDSIKTKDLDICFVSQSDDRRFANAEDSPFASNPNAFNRGVYHIVYNQEIIDVLALNDREIMACLAHEVGHFIFAEVNPLIDSTDKEPFCDKVAVYLELSFPLATALVKMSSLIDGKALDERLNRLFESIVLYRPEWTCGRYDFTRHAAILYNLIEGYCYYFDDDSADIIGLILDHKRKELFKLNDLKTGNAYSSGDIIGFIEELIARRLLVTNKLTSDDILEYKTAVATIRKSNTEVNETKDIDSFSINPSSAEMDYTDRVGGITSVMLELTYNCSEKCIHCYNPGASRNDRESSERHLFKQLSLDSYKQVIDNLYDNGLIKVCLTGGDPFSYADCWAIIEYLYQKEIACEIYTNGQGLIDKVDKLAQYYPCLVGISIYSGLAKVHDSITRTKGSFDKTIQVLSCLTEQAIPTVIKCCIIKQNLKSYYSVRKIALEYGCTIQYEINIVDAIDGDKCASTYLRLSPEEYEIVLCDPLIMGNPDNFHQPLHAERLNAPPCRAGHNSFCITPTGDVIPCCAFHLSFGNIHVDSIEAIVNNPVLVKWKNTKISDFDKCGHYEYCAACQLCAGNNYTEHKDFRKAGENNCYLAKVRYRYMMKMKDGYDFLQGKTVEEKLESLDITIETPRKLL